MVRAGRGIGARPSVAAIFAWVARPGLAERGERARAAAQHHHEHARLTGDEPLHVAAELVDPHRYLEAERGGHGVLAVGATGQEHVLAALGEVREGGEQRRELAEEDLVGAAHLEELPGLRDVLGGGAPVHVAAGVALARLVERPDQRHERVARLREPGAHRVHVQELEPRLLHDLALRRLGDDAELGLGARQRGLVVQPGLEARGLGEERPHAGIGNAKGSGLVLHGEVSARAGRYEGLTREAKRQRSRARPAAGGGSMTSVSVPAVWSEQLYFSVPGRRKGIRYVCREPRMIGPT